MRVCGHLCARRRGRVGTVLCTSPAPGGSERRSVCAGTWPLRRIKPQVFVHLWRSLSTLNLSPVAPLDSWQNPESEYGSKSQKPLRMRRLHKAIDFVVCLGGDGVLLHASSLYKRAIPPVISFNLGSLGFLTNHTFDDFRRDLRDVITGCEDLTECSLPGEVMRVRHVCSSCSGHSVKWRPCPGKGLTAPARNPHIEIRNPRGRVHGGPSHHYVFAGPQPCHCSVRCKDDAAATLSYPQTTVMGACWAGEIPRAMMS